MITPTGQNLAFLLGQPRSGTTLAGVMLQNHPRVACPPEPWLMLALESFGKTSHRHPADSQLLGSAVRELTRGQGGIDAARAHALSLYNARLASLGKSFLIDKTPRYFLILPYLRQLFPDAKMIWLRRNPLDVAASYLTSWNSNLPDYLRTHPEHLHLVDLVLGARLLFDFARKQPGELYWLKYEDLVANPQAYLDSLQDFLGLDRVSGLEEFDVQRTELPGAFTGDKKIFNTHAPHQRSIDSWRREFSKDQLQLLFDALGAPLMRELGYQSTVDELMSMGVEDRGSEVTDEIVARLEVAVAERMADVNAVSSAGVDAEKAMQQSIDSGILQTHALTRMTQEDRKLREQLQVLELAEQSARADLEQARIDHQRELADELSKRQTEHVVILTAELDRLSPMISVAEKRAEDASKEAETHRASQQELHEELERTQKTLETLQADLDRTRDDLKITEQQRLTLAEAQADQSQRLTEINSALQALDLPREAPALSDALKSIVDSHRSLTELRSEHTQKVTELTYWLEVYHNTDKDRLHWIARASDYEKQLRQIEDYSVFERLVDTTGRIAKQTIIGRSYVTSRRARGLPRISIVTPCFNAEDTIRETIESVIGQNYPHLEYIIVDGGSTDRTVPIIEEFRARGFISHVIYEPDKGMYDAIAKGFDASTGDVLGYLNADDMFEPGGLLRVGEFFRDHLRAVVVYHEDTVTVDGWRFANRAQPHVDLYKLLKGHILFQDGVFFRRPAYFNVGGMDRTLRLAGDYDLWLKLARRYAFTRAPGHISSFRVRAGQLSNQMDKYNAEMSAARAAFLKTFTPSERLRHLRRHLQNRIKNGIESIFARRKLFFVMDFANMPPPPAIKPLAAQGQPLCPLTGRPPDRLLFSTRDTRFGDQLINYVYYNRNSQLAMAYPPLSREHLTALYEKHYSDADAKVIAPLADGCRSPYQHYKGGGRLSRWIVQRDFPDKLINMILGPWKDNTADELLATLHKRFPARGRVPRFFDVGCFEGNLLDEIKQRTDWITCGLEPNARAVQVATGKGHQVWQAGAEDAPFVVPQGKLFDVIFLGQTVEHLEHPPTVIRRLRDLLAPGGVIVLSTPNLDSKQIELFGPTWAHWHLPYHRTLFNRNSLGRLAKCAAMRLVQSRTYSHPYWSALSLQLNEIGLGGAVPHGQKTLEDRFIRPAQKLAAWSALLWDWRGKGDYIYATLARQD